MLLNKLFYKHLYYNYIIFTILDKVKIIYFFKDCNRVNIAKTYNNKTIPFH